MGIEVADGYVNYIHMYLDIVLLFSMPPLSDGLDQGQWTFLRAHAQMVYQFQRILSCVHWDFEEQNKVLESSIIIINYFIIIIIFIMMHIMII